MSYFSSRPGLDIFLSIALIPALLILFLAKWLVEFVSIWEILFQYKKMLYAGIFGFDAGISVKKLEKISKNYIKFDF